MKEWNPEKYLLFKKQRTQPAIDLVNRLSNQSFYFVTDLGCGPGNSTRVLKDKFPNSKILGIDNSVDMIAKAKEENKDLDFKVGSVSDLDFKCDLLFSNACLQWVPNHEELLPNLMNHLNPNGVLAVQVPNNKEEPLFKVIDEVIDSYKINLRELVTDTNEVLAPSDYYEILSKCSSSFELWETTYYHIMPSHEALLEWVRGTRLRPFLKVLNESDKVDFESKILKRIAEEYKVTSKGEVILKFKRLFFIAKK